MKDDSKKALYHGCTSFTRLSATLKLFNIKAKSGWADKNFSELLELLHVMLPEGNTLSTRHYEVKKILYPMCMSTKKIHACPNDYILYRKEFETLTKCPRYRVLQYKVKDDDEDEDNMKKGPPAKMLWYLPIIPRLKRLFANVDDAKNLQWHANGRKSDGLLRHAADSPQW